MHKTHLYLALIFLSSFAFHLSPLQAVPRLTVVVVVDGLRQDNLDQLRPYWQQGGLRLMSEEAYQTTIAFPHLVYGGNETTATLMTGVTPSSHGYALDNYFSRSDRHIHPLLDDEKEKGIGSEDAFSPRALLSPTIGDKLRMRVGQNAKIFAVGIHPETTVLLAGHSANGCCWIDEAHRCWASTSFYPVGLPSVADEMNVNGHFEEMAAKLWTPRLNITSYISPTEHEIRKSFTYYSNEILRQAPVANTLVIELALALQKAEKLGMDQTQDLLLLELNTVTPAATADRIQSAEQEDMHLCLNQDLGYLIEQLQRRIGRQHFEVLVVGRPVLGIGAETMTMAGMPVNQFNVDRAAALISTYLMALYGHERWVDGGYGQSIFLNRTLIEQKKISLQTIQRQVANFLMEFEGVQAAFPQNEALLYPELAGSLNKRQTGDVVFTLLPGWQLYASDKRPLDTVLESNPTAPLLYWSGNLLHFPDGRFSATDLPLLLSIE